MSPHSLHSLLPPLSFSPFFLSSLASSLSLSPSLPSWYPVELFLFQLVYPASYRLTTGRAPLVPAQTALSIQLCGVRLRVARTRYYKLLVKI